MHRKIQDIWASPPDIGIIFGRMSREARKRPGGATEGSSASGKVSIDEIELTELRHHSSALGKLHAPINSMGIYHMDSKAEKEQLARDIWTLSIDESMAVLRENNAELVEVLRAQIANTTTATAEFIEAKERLIDGMLLDICRAQNQKRMPFAYTIHRRGLWVPAMGS